jgi:hypothetical protein
MKGPGDSGLESPTAGGQKKILGRKDKKTN